MTEKPTANSVLGLELTPRELKVVHLTYRQGKPAFHQLFSILVDQEHSTPLNVKLLYTKEEEKTVQSLIQKSLVVSAIPSSGVLIRDLDIQLTKEKDIDQVLEFQAEPVLPYPIDEAIIDRIILEKTGEGTKLAIAAVRRDHLTQHLEAFHSLGIEPEVISCTPAAMAGFSSYFGQSEGTHFILHLGWAESTCCLINGGKLISSQGCRKGIQTLASSFSADSNLTGEDLVKGMESLDFGAVSEDSHPQLFGEINNYRLEITKIFFSLSKQLPGQEVQETLVVGGGALLQNLAKTLCINLKKTLTTPAKKPNVSLSENDLIRFALPIGMGLTALPHSKDQINFRQKEYIYPYPWKRIKKPMAIYFSLSLALSAVLYLFGQSYIAKEEDDLKKSYVNLLVLMKKPFQEFEKEFHKSNPSARSFEDQKDPYLLSQQDIRKRIGLLEKEIKETPDIFPLQPNTPRVSDVLAWLSSHPHIKVAEEGAPGAAPGIQLESFSYKMVKRPEHNKMKERYQARVEIEFTAPTPRYAREFHDILLAPNDIVDPTSDLNWSAERGRYRAAFFLKDRTNYPSLKGSST